MKATADPSSPNWVLPEMVQRRNDHLDAQVSAPLPQHEIDRRAHAASVLDMP